MEEVMGVVQRLDENHQAWVLAKRKSACSDCHDHHGCCAMAGGGSDIMVKAKNSIGAHPGDHVMLRINRRIRIKWMLMLYFIPVAGALIGALIGAWLWHTNGATVLTTLAGVIGGFVLLRFLAGNAKGANELTPEIVEKQKPGGASGKKPLSPGASGCCA